MNEETITSLDEEAQELTPIDLYNRLLIEDELLITILVDQEELLRRGIISAKAKENQKLKDQGHPTDTSILQFASTPSKVIEGAIVVHVSLVKRKTITVLAIAKPEDNI